MKVNHKNTTHIDHKYLFSKIRLKSVLTSYVGINVKEMISLHHPDCFHRAGFLTAGTAVTEVVVIQHRVGFMVTVNIGFSQDDAA